MEKNESENIGRQTEELFSRSIRVTTVGLRPPSVTLRQYFKLK